MSYGDALGLAILVGVLAVIFWMIFAIAAYIISALFIRKLLRLAGHPSPNQAWIPVYNGMLWAKLTDLNPWVYLIAVGGAGIVASILSAIPYVGPFLAFIIGLVPAAVFVVMVYRTNQKVGKAPVGWTIFGVLLSLIWMIVLLASKDLTWRTGPQNGIPAPFWHNWGPFFQDSTTFGGVPDQGYPVTAGPAGPPQTPPPAAPPAPPAPQTPPPAV